MVCDDEKVVAGKIAVLADKVPTTSSYKDAIAAVRKGGRPLTLDAVEAAMDKIGGAAKFGEMIADDISRLRGDHLEPALREAFEQDFKTTKGLYELLTRMMATRDEMVGGSVDPLEGLTEEDLMAMASQAAFIQIGTDPAFRLKMLNEIAMHDPDAVMQVAMEVMDQCGKGAKVEVLG
jgi:hypothetical protein